MIWTVRPDATLDYLNGTHVEFTELPIEKCRDEDWLDAVHPQGREGQTPVVTTFPIPSVKLE
jgi:hypothetical protein